VKAQAVAALTKEYPSSQVAIGGIEKHLRDYYRSTYPDLLKSKPVQIDQAVKATQAIFQTTIFPDMKVDWRTHPDHIGHFYSNGCFRCHDDNHVSANGKLVSKKCDICHDVLSQSENGTPLPASADFQHPIDLGDLAMVNCADCHTGGSME
jgi:hypothetical protein